MGNNNEETIIQVNVFDRLRSWKKRIDSVLEKFEDTDDMAALSTLRKMSEDLRWIHHPANGELRDVVTGSELQVMGVTKGILDICITAPSTDWHGARIEVKSATGSTTPEQDEYIEYCASRGIKTLVSSSPRFIEYFIMDYISGGMVRALPIEDAMSPTTLTHHGCVLTATRSMESLNLLNSGVEKIEKGADILQALNGGKAV